MDAGELDLDDLPPKALRKLIKSLLAKRGKPADDKQAEESDKEREDLADLHEEKKGKTEGVPATEDDMPFDLGSDDGSDEDSSEEDSQLSDTEPPVAKKPFPKKKGK